MANTTLTEIPSAVQQFYDRVLLERALPLLVHDKFGQRRPLPKNNSKVIKFRRYEALTPNTTPISEGVIPDGTQLSITDVSATIASYGDYIKLTDQVQLFNVEPVLTEAAEVLGEQAGQSLDMIWREALHAGTNVYFSGTATQRSEVQAVISAAVLDKVVRLLEGNNAKKFTDVIAGRDRYNTTPIPAAYFAICHTDLRLDLKGLSGWVPVEKYPDPKLALEGEIGTYDCIRFIGTTNGKIYKGSGATLANPTVKYTLDGTDKKVDVYTILVFGKNAYGITDLQGEALKFIVKPLGSAGTSDPLNQFATSGWKAFTVAKILNDAFMCRVETAVSL